MKDWCVHSSWHSLRNGLAWKLVWMFWTIAVQPTALRPWSNNGHADEQNYDEYIFLVDLGLTARPVTNGPITTMGCMNGQTDGHTNRQTDRHTNRQTDKFWSLGTLLRLTDFLCHGLSNECCKRFNVAMRNKRRRDSQRLDGTKASHTTVYIIEIWMWQYFINTLS